MKNNLLRSLGVACLLVLMGSTNALAEYPERQITLIVPFGAGGGSDRVARTVDKFWTEQTGQSMSFQYKPGASGAIGTDAIARAPNDGYTIGIVNMPTMIIQPVSGAASFQLTDFDFIGKVNSDPLVLMVSDDSPYQTLEDFITAARENPNTLTLAITGTLSSAHIVALKLTEDAAIDLTLVPTQGGANTVARTAGGHVSAGLIGLGLFTRQENGRALAISGPNRSEFAPDLPTFTEQGINIDLTASRVFVAPRGLPAEALEYLRTNLAKTAQSEAFQAAFRTIGQGPVWQSGAELEQEALAQESEINALLKKYQLIQ